MLYYTIVSVQEFTEISQSADELLPKTFFLMADIPHLNIKSVHTRSSDCHRVPCSNNAVAYQISSKWDDFWLRYDDLTICNMEL